MRMKPTGQRRRASECVVRKRPNCQRRHAPDSAVRRDACQDARPLAAESRRVSASKAGLPEGLGFATADWDANGPLEPFMLRGAPTLSTERGKPKLIAPDDRGLQERAPVGAANIFHSMGLSFGKSCGYTRMVPDF